MSSRRHGPAGDGLKDGGRLRVGVRSAGAGLRAALHGEVRRQGGGAGSEGDWRRRVARPMPVLAVVLAVFAVADRPGASLPQKAVLVLSAIPLALLFRQPLLAWLLSVLAAVFGQLLGPGTAWPTNPVQVLVFAATLFVVALTRPRPVVLGVGVISLIGIVLAVPATDRPVIALPALLMVAGDQIRQRRAVQETLAQEEERSAVLAERTRIARELHDVVAHSMSLLAVRAETAPFRLHADLPEPVRVEFAEISVGARQALVEMRRVLGVLRSEDHGAVLAPQPGLSDIPALIDADRAAGAHVTLEFEPLPPVSDALGLTAYRVVQEALANAARHAPGAAVHVALRAMPATTGVHRVEIRVRNAPSARAASSGGGLPRGHGLLGMRERVAAVDGQLTVGPTDDGGFEVHVLLPLPPATPSQVISA